MCLLADCYVADELIVSRAGRRVRVGNTDAEGRMVMVDLLCEMKEKVHTHVRAHTSRWIPCLPPSPKKNFFVISLQLTENLVCVWGIMTV